MGCFKNPIQAIENSVHDAVNFAKDPTSKNFAKAANVAGNFVSPRAEMAIGDTIATAFGGSAFIPVINAGITAATDRANGQSVGKSLGQGAITGAESLAAQEAAGAIGFGEGNTAFNNAAGITWDNPSSLGLPDIGGAASKSIGLTGSGSSAAGTAGPAGAAGGSGDVTLSAQDPYGLHAAGGQVGSSLSSSVSPNVGAGTVGNPGVGNVGTGSFDINGTLNGGGVSPSLSSAANAASSAPSSLGGKALDFITKHPSADIAALGLGLDAIKGDKPVSGEGALKSEAQQLSAQGKQLQGYLDSGTLPPGLQGSLDQATQAAKATIRSQYASRGMSGSSAEQQDLAQVDQRAQAQGAQMAMQLLQTGISESGMASQIYQSLLNANLAEDKGLEGAISNFAGALGGGGQGVTLKVSQ